MQHEDLARWAARAGEWAADYHRTLRERPVRPQLAPGEIAARLPSLPPEQPEPPERIFADFARIVVPGLTHWQHPRFFAYFPANASPASMLAEQLAAALGVNAMLWQTSPAATELEQVMVQWLAEAVGLGGGRFRGTLHDTASTATLAAVVAMRERALEGAGNRQGLAGGPTVRLYASAEAHSSVEKAARVAGIGRENLVRVPTTADRGMDPDSLARAIETDRAAGRLPIGVVLTAGSTGTGAFDPIGPCIEVARAFALPVHVDAAWAGSAMICPELRHLWAGVEEADSIVLNPHKWLGAQFDCSLQLVAEPEHQIRALGLKPAYLETTDGGDMTDFTDWTIPLGRRFRALKLWFHLRAYGLEALREMIRSHVAWTAELAGELARIPGVEIVTAPVLGLFTFRLAPVSGDPDAATRELLERINADGRVFLTRTLVDGSEAIRVSVGSWATRREDVACVAQVVREMAPTALREQG